MSFVFDETEIRKAISILKPEGRDFEIRMVAGKKWNMAGVFRSADSLMDALKNARVRTDANVYIVLNRLHDACYSRKHHDQFVEYMTPTVSDNDIIGYDWLLIDIDPKRPADTSSTNEQVKESRELARRIRAYLMDRGWNEPVVAASGNGTHLLYSIALENNNDCKTLIQKVLQTLGMLFANDRMDVDLTTFNPARICKLYGTVARKGANTEERPHRMSKILVVPDRIEPTPAAFLEALTRMLPQQEAPQQYNNYKPAQFNLQDWIDRHHIDVAEKTTWSGGTKWILDHCPFNPEHNHKDAAIVQTSDGKICYHCFHNSCADKHWREFRQFYEPDAYTKSESIPPAVPNYLLTKPDSFGQIQPPEAPEFSDTPDGPVFRTTEEIRNRKAPEEAHILTGITSLDKRMIGLKKGYVTVLSGLRSAGKSSVLSQLVIQCREQGLKCAMFSGEMTDKQVLKWQTLQAAGKAHVHGTQYENVFYPNDDAAVAVSAWLNDFVYVYNNDYGNKFSLILDQTQKIVTEKQLDLVLLDNLMAINVEELDRDQYVRQTKFITALKRMAQSMNIHVLFVAHPRKSQGYLRMDDIAGSGDLANAADNVLIVHRVNADYRKATMDFFRWKADNPIYKASNVIEICKDRDFGTVDCHVPLYFEKETKRLRNTETEYIHYGWESDLSPAVLAAKDFEIVEDVDLPF